IFLRFWQPKTIYRFEDERAEYQRTGHTKHTYTAGQVLKAWMPFAILSIFVLVWGLPKVKLAMNKATTPAFSVILPDGRKRPRPPGWDVPYLHNAVTRAAPVVTKPTPEAARYDFNWLSATGTGCFFAAIVYGLLLGRSPIWLMKRFRHPLVGMRLCDLGISF